MIWVAGDAALVEYKQQVSSDPVGDLETCKANTSSLCPASPPSG